MHIKIILVIYYLSRKFVKVLSLDQIKISQLSKIFITEIIINTKLYLEGETA